MALHVAALGCVGAGQQKLLLEECACRGRLLVDVVLVPPLLQVVGGVVVAAIGVSERDVADVVGRQCVGARCEIVDRCAHEERMPADEDIVEHRLATAIRSHDGDVLAVERREVDRVRHTPFGHPCHPLPYADGGLHTRCLFLFTKSFHPLKEACESGRPICR